ncbi:hypothetical protein JCM10908_003628 [Rhodotorula pacifica]|uniref:uncharacterized protein n=1 Tax=Rhodotorula pacifica TaxID=1495444 RepID=UPI00316CD5B4
MATAPAAAPTSQPAQPTPRPRSRPRPRPRPHHAPLYDADATILLIGMRGVGKTTLGLIAATSLRRHFIDADSAFQTLHGPISSFVTTHGWPEFRNRETEILTRLVDQHPKGYVIACGGGVVEREENRTLLERFKNEIGPIVHVVRDEDETVRYLVDESARPAWGEEIRAVWARRRNYYETLCTHTIASLTARPASPSPQFLMKHVETAFVRLLRSIFGFASSHVPLVAGPRPPPTSGPSSGEYGGYGACESELGRGAKGPRTSFVALNFADLMSVEAEVVRQVAGGVDVIEMRVDTLVEPERVSSALNSRAGSPAPPPLQNGSSSSTAIAQTAKRRRFPSLQFVAMCFGHLRRCSPLPILYTVRTESQGGVFPDPYPRRQPDGSSSGSAQATVPDASEDPEDLMSSYLSLVKLGFKLGAEYVDVELALPDRTISHFVSLSGAATRVLGADHDRKGQWRWESQDVMDKYKRAKRLGCDLVKLVSTPTEFRSNLELLNFRAKVDELSAASPSPGRGRQRGNGRNAEDGDAEMQGGRAGGDEEDEQDETETDEAVVPLLAINLGKGGQISRYLNPVLTPVTHPLLPGVAAPGQITFQQTQQALFLSGLLLEKTFFVSSESLAEVFTREASRLGLPYSFEVETFDPAEVTSSAPASALAPVPNFGGSYIFPNADTPATLVSTLPSSDEVLPPAAATGYSDLCVPACTEPLSYDVPPTPLGHYKHTNVRVLALAELITQNLSPINAVGTHTCALLVGLGRKDRAEVVEALRMVGARWVFVLACEGDDGEVLPMNMDGSGPVSRAGSPAVAGGGGGGGEHSLISAAAAAAGPSSSRPGTPSGFAGRSGVYPQSHTPVTLPYPEHAPLTVVPLSSFSTPILYSKRPPTIIVSSDQFCPVPRHLRYDYDEPPAFPDKLFCSPTGGCALDLSLSYPRTKQGILSHCIRQKRLRTSGTASDGWQVLGKREVQAECEKQAFRALTGRRLG